MKTIPLTKAEKNLGKLVKQARLEAIALTDKGGHVVALLAGVGEDELDDLLVRTPAFKSMMAKSAAAVKHGKLISLDDLEKELAAEQ